MVAGARRADDFARPLGASPGGESKRRGGERRRRRRRRGYPRALSPLPRLARVRRRRSRVGASPRRRGVPFARVRKSRRGGRRAVRSRRVRAPGARGGGGYKGIPPREKGRFGGWFGGSIFGEGGARGWPRGDAPIVSSGNAPFPRGRPFGARKPFDPDLRRRGGFRGVDLRPRLGRPPRVVGRELRGKLRRPSARSSSSPPRDAFPRQPQGRDGREARRKGTAERAREPGSSRLGKGGEGTRRRRVSLRLPPRERRVVRSRVPWGFFF